MDRSNEMGTTRNRYAKIQPLFDRNNRLQTRNPFNNNNARWGNELGADSYLLQLHNNIGSLALATNTENDKTRSSKVPASSFDQQFLSPGTIMGETVRKQKKHKHRNKERFYYAPLLDFKTELLDVINFIFYIMWCPVIFFVRFILTILTWPAYALINLFKWIVRKTICKEDSGGSTDIKPEEKQASDSNKCFHDFDISFLKAEVENKAGGMLIKDRKGRKESQSSRRKSIPPLKLVNDTRRTREKYFQYLSRHQNVSSVELSSDCQSDEPSSRFFETKDCSKNKTRKFQDSVSLAGKKTLLSTLRHSSFKRNHTENKNLKNLDLSQATDDQITDFKNQLINRYSSMAREEKLDVCKSSAVASQPIDLRKKSYPIARLPLKPTSLKESVFGVKKLDSKSTAMSEVQNTEPLNNQAAKESCFDPLSEANLDSHKCETVSKYLTKSDGPKTQTAMKPEKDVAVPDNLEKETVGTGSGDRPTMSKASIRKTAEFTNPIDAKSKWLEMKKKFYGKDYVVAVKEEPEKIEAPSLARIASSTKLPAHKIFQYNMLVGRARQMGSEPPPPDETLLKKTATSSCLTETEDQTKTRIEPVTQTARCLSQTRSLSQWPESNSPFRTKEQKPRPKPRTKGGISPDRILADNNVSTIDHLTSTEVETPSENQNGDSKSRMWLKSAPFEQKPIEKLVHLSDEEVYNQDGRVSKNLMGMDAQFPIHNRAAPLQWSTAVRNQANINSVCNHYTEQIDSLISF